MAQRNDQVFQLSLTEIAFTVSFILLLLLGYLVFKEQSDRKAAEEALASIHTSERITEAMQQATEELARALEHSGTANPSESISRLVEAEKVREERNRLRREVDDLDVKLSALTEIQQLLQESAASGRDSAIRESVVSALALQREVAKALEDTTEPSEQPKKEPTRGRGAGFAAPPIQQVKDAISTARTLRTQLKEQLGKTSGSPEEIRDVVQAAKSYRELTKSGLNIDSVRRENSDLRGQVAFLKNRLDARGGRDYPPCWADETGKVEFLFGLELRSDGIVLTRAWPDRRAADAADLPGIAEALAAIHSHAEFPRKVQPIFNWSRRQDPECRHYVQLRSSIADAVSSDRARLMVENYFYKVEARR